MQWFSSIPATSLVLFLTLSGQVHAGMIYSDDFSSNSGWTLEHTWQIGPATTSPSVSPYYPDPAQDHSPTADNGILGAAIGGNVGAPDGLHDFWWATSPVIDAGSYKNVTLEYYRWLNSDYYPFMTSRVEGWDGNNWVLIWESTVYGTNPTDTSWVLQSFDVSALADHNSQFQIRFGYDVMSSGVYTVSGWNVDDLQVFGVHSAPEPGSLALLGMGMGFAATWCVRKRLRNKSESGGQ